MSIPPFLTGIQEMRYIALSGLAQEYWPHGVEANAGHALWANAISVKRARQAAVAVIKRVQVINQKVARLPRGEAGVQSRSPYGCVSNALQKFFHCRLADQHVRWPGMQPIGRSKPTPNTTCMGSWPRQLRPRGRRLKAMENHHRGKTWECQAQRRSSVSGLTGVARCIQ